MFSFRHKWFLSVLLGSLAISAFGIPPVNASIAKIERHRVVWLSRTQTSTSQVKPRTVACLYRAKRPRLCGIVSSVTPKYFSLTLRKLGDLKVGASVEVRTSTRTTASTSTTASYSTIRRQTGTAFFDIAGEIVVGPRYYFPSLHLQAALSRKFSLGFMPIVSSSSRQDYSITAYGGYLTAAYYLSHHTFRGIFLQGGLGVIQIETKVTGLPDKATSPAGIAMLGWRGAIFGALGIGVSGGVQYVNYTSSYVDITFKGLLPIVTAFLSCSF